MFCNDLPMNQPVPVDSWVNHYKTLLSNQNSKSSFPINNNKHNKKIKGDLEKLEVKNFLVLLIFR